MKTVVFVALGLVVVRRAPAQATPNWAISPAPVTAIGLADGSADEELTGVSGARRLSDGRVVVANGKPLEIRIYSAKGALLSRFGRRGQGPGEFNGAIQLMAAGGDSIVAYDRLGERLGIFWPTGKVVREWATTATGSTRGQVVLRRRSLGNMLLPATSSCFVQLVDRLPPLNGTSLRNVFPDDAGRFWINVDGSSKWTAYSSAGRVLGSIMLPNRFIVYQFSGGYVVGKALLNDDIEQVQVLRISAPPDKLVLNCRPAADSATFDHSARAEELTKALHAAITAGEMAYSDYARYVTTLDSLPRLRDQLPPATSFRVLSADRGGWAAALFDNRSSLVCIFGLADSALPGWPDGPVRCAR